MIKSKKHSFWHYHKENVSFDYKNHEQVETFYCTNLQMKDFQESKIKFTHIIVSALQFLPIYKSLYCSTVTIVILFK